MLNMMVDFRADTWFWRHLRQVWESALVTHVDQKHLASPTHDLSAIKHEAFVLFSY